MYWLLYDEILGCQVMRFRQYMTQVGGVTSCNSHCCPWNAVILFETSSENQSRHFATDISRPKPRCLYCPKIFLNIESALAYMTNPNFSHFPSPTLRKTTKCFLNVQINSNDILQVYRDRDIMKWWHTLV